MLKEKRHFGLVLLVLVVLGAVLPSDSQAFIFRRRAQPFFGNSNNNWTMQPSQRFQNETCCRDTQPQREVQASIQAKNDNFAVINGFPRLVNIGGKLFEHTRANQFHQIIINPDGSYSGLTDPDTINDLRRFMALDESRTFFGEQARLAFRKKTGAFSPGKFLISCDINPGVEHSKVQDPQQRAQYGMPALPDPSSETNNPSLDMAGNWGKYQKFNAIVTSAQLSSALNHISLSDKIIRIEPGQCAEGRPIALDLNHFFSRDQLDLLNQADPNAWCNGGQIRLSALMQFVMNPKNYYEFLRMPKTKAEFAREYGIPPRKELYAGIPYQDGTGRQFTGSHALVASRDGTTTESGVVRGPFRILGQYDSTKHGWCYGSYDGAYPPRDGNARSRDPRHHGILNFHDAEEWICMGTNGFRRYALYANDATGSIQETAPGDIAQWGNGADHAGTTIRAGGSCTECHAGGLLYGYQRTQGKAGFRDIQPGKQRERLIYSDNTDLIPATPFLNFRDRISGWAGNITHRDFFIPARSSNPQLPNYYSKAQYDSAVSLQAEAAAGALVAGSEWLDLRAKPYKYEKQVIPILGRGISKYYDALTQADAARELGVSERALDGVWAGLKARGFVVPESAEALRGPNAKDTKWVIKRDDFEDAFCHIKQGLLAQAGPGIPHGGYDPNGGYPGAHGINPGYGVPPGPEYDGQRPRSY